MTSFNAEKYFTRRYNFLMKKINEEEDKIFGSGNYMFFVEPMSIAGLPGPKLENISNFAFQF
jgi:hypothetical protein